MSNIWPRVAWTEALDKQWSNRIARRGETRGRASVAKRAICPPDAVIYYVQRTSVLNKVPFCSIDLHHRWRPCFLSRRQRFIDREAKNVHHLLWNTDSARELSSERSLNFLRWILQVAPSFLGYFVKWLFLSEFPH